MLQFKEKQVVRVKLCVSMGATTAETYIEIDQGRWDRWTDGDREEYLQDAVDEFAWESIERWAEVEELPAIV